MSICLGHPALRELRIHLCQCSIQSEGIRTFLQHNYVSIKRCYPHLPILIRECCGISPVAWARYHKGLEYCMSLANLSPEQVQKTLHDLCNKG